MKNRNFCIVIASDYQTIISKNLKVVGLLGEKIDFFLPLRIQIEIDFISYTQESSFSHL